MNEDTWENLDASEQGDPELVSEYLNDAPVRFGECELPAEIHNIWKDGLRRKEMENNSWNAPDRRKEYSQSKQLWEDGSKLESWILKRMEQDWEKS